MNKLTRRDFIKLMGVGAGTLTLNACGLVPSASSFDLSTVPVSLAVDLTAGKTTLPLFSGVETSVLQYQASVREGSAELLQNLSGSYLGPIFRVKQGQRIQVRLNNELSDSTIIHWHGLRLTEEMDGHPRYAIKPGDTYDYDFQVLNRAGMYWFHPHTHGLTGPQVYYGLAGLFIVSDEEEAALNLPAGEYDLPLVIQDRMFDAENQMVYLGNDMTNQMIGVLGDTILVNGAPNAKMDVKASAYRLRLLNGSNSRIYKLAWQDGTPLTVIATDGGLLEAPVTRDYITLSPGERVEVWADFSGSTGSEMRLVSLPFSEFSSSTGETMGGNSSVSNGASLDILSLNIGEKGADVSPLPALLSTITRHRVEEAVNQNEPRSFALTMQGMTHAINGRVFEIDKVARDEIVRLGDLEIWEFVNLEGSDSMGGMDMGMMDIEMPHPMHIHGVLFQVLKREITQGYEETYQELSAGFVDDGWKDTVLVMPGEKVQVLVRFEDFTGTFVHHCHNLEHSDTGMMRNYRIKG